MCPPPDAPVEGKEEMVPIDTTQPSLPPPSQTGPAETNNANGKPSSTPANGDANGHSHPPAVKSHKGLYNRPSDFLSNTSNWKVSAECAAEWSGMGCGCAIERKRPFPWFRELLFRFRGDSSCELGRVLRRDAGVLCVPLVA
jgi:hypothetical protein